MNEYVSCNIQKLSQSALQLQTQMNSLMCTTSSLLWRKGCFRIIKVVATAYGQLRLFLISSTCKFALTATP